MASDARPDGGHEFAGSENRTISGLSTSMWIVGLALIVLGVLMGVVHGYTAIQGLTAGTLVGLVVALMYLVMGLWTLDASRGFRKIVTTQGRDVQHLMTALDGLRKLYTVQAVVVVVGFALVVAAFALGFTSALKR